MSVSPDGTPQFGDLTRRDSLALLRRNHVGRVAFVRRNILSIEPIHYVYTGDWIHCRTADGLKLNVLSHHPWVAFEVDEIDGLFDWKSVVVRGTFYRFDPSGNERDKKAHRRAVRALRRIIPETMLAGDPVAFRTVICGIFIHEITGRSAQSR
jgi:hypothetical protein